ncbi:hypothetical protein BN2497_10123 [Janthinobacterium sp. CG23_2]|nr:hypothetical protein BN2497_10123 [Janthinobacterium sp. CG23_2]CUU31459.1 hypothetical protein BN3177_10123 [Janthinobacterium sp. CG23_2]
MPDKTLVYVTATENPLPFKSCYRTAANADRQELHDDPRFVSHVKCKNRNLTPLRSKCRVATVFAGTSPKY